MDSFNMDLYHNKWKKDSDLLITWNPQIYPGH